jgi:hypothetical protein
VVDTHIPRCRYAIHQWSVSNERDTKPKTLTRIDIPTKGMREVSRRLSVQRGHTTYWVCVGQPSTAYIVISLVNLSTFVRTISFTTLTVADSLTVKFLNPAFLRRIARVMPETLGTHAR